MTTWWLWCTSRWSSMRCCRPSILSTRATRTRACWSTVEQQYGVTIVGPVADDPSWQARSDDGLTKSQFLVDWDRQVVTCPAGKQSISWLPNTWPESGMVFEARFARKDCTPCSLRSRCTRAKNEPRIIEPAGARALRGAAIRPPASDDGGVQAKICCALRGRRYARAGNQSLRAAALPIYRIGQDPSAARDNSRRRQLGQDRRLARRYSCGSDAPLTLRCPANGRLIGAPNSPPVSTFVSPAAK